jgi:Neutral/alkaline non-lysosomal ceramidase, N-terminal
MNDRIAPACWAVLTGMIFFCFSDPLCAAEEPYPWKAGAAEVSILPDGPMLMSGYASRDKPYETVGYDIKAAAIALEDADGNRLVIVGIDLITVSSVVRDAVVAEVEKRLGIKSESILLNASHTHTGPEPRGDLAQSWGRAAEQVKKCHAYRKQLITRIVEAITLAVADLKPAHLEYSFARAGFSMNRRRPIVKDGKTSFINRPYPEGPVDQQVPVLKIADPSGKEIRAILFGYACHSTTLGGLELTGDYPGFAKEELQRRYPGVVPVFLAGCGGDQNPYPRHKSTQQARDHGRTLALAVEAALVTVMRPVAGPLHLELEKVELRFAPPPAIETIKVQAKSKNVFARNHAKALLAQLENDGKITDTHKVPIQVVRFDDSLLLFAMPGETVVDYSLKIKSKYGSTIPVWVAGYSNDVFGYLPSVRVLHEGGYEGGGAFLYSNRFPGPLDESVESRVLEKVDQLVRKTRK